MKNNKHVESFGQFNENLNISDVSDSKEQLKHFLDYIRRYHVSNIPMDKIDEYVDSYIKSVGNNDVFIKMMNNGK